MKDLKNSNRILYLITNKHFVKEKDFFTNIEQALIAGVKLIQLREKDSSYEEFVSKAIKIKTLTKKYGAKLIINDNIDVAIASNADGIHLGQEDLENNSIKKITKEMIIGISVSSLEEAKAAIKLNPDYIGVGAMFKTKTKNDAKMVSLKELKKIIDFTKIPIICIGGIKLKNLRVFSNLEIKGFAVVSAIWRSKNIDDECKKWLFAIREKN